MKKYQAGGGIREGRARFGDDVRERAREEMARRAAGVEAMPVKPPVSTKPKPPAKPKPDAKPTPKAETPKAVPTPTPKAETKAAPKTLREALSEGMSEVNRPRPPAPREPGGLGILGMFIDEDKVRGTKKAKGGSVKMAKGGYVRKADGCAVKGKTKGRFV
jgi:outer membrane biosynthesis protein TonB